MWTEAASWGRVSDPLDIGRGLLEPTRPITGVVGAGGGSADPINGWQDLLAFEAAGADDMATQTYLILRTILTTTNNAFGHLLHCDQVLQDGLIMLGVTAEGAIFTAPINQVLKPLEVGVAWARRPSTRWGSRPRAPT